MAYLGIDIGSSSIKAGWLDLRTGEIADSPTSPPDISKSNSPPSSSAPAN